MDIHLEMRHALGSIDKETRSGLMGEACHLLHGIDGSEHIAHLATAHELRAFIEELAIGIEVEVARIVHRDDAYDDAIAFADELPRHDIAVVLHDGEDDLVAGVEEGLCE